MHPWMGIVFLIVSIFITACGDTSTSSSLPKISGTGVVENVSSIDWSGVALHDEAKGRFIDISSLPAEAVSIGDIVDYAGHIEAHQGPMGGQPTRVRFTKFNIIGIEN